MDSRHAPMKSEKDVSTTKPTLQLKTTTWSVSSLLFSAGCKSQLQCIAGYLVPPELAILDMVCMVFRRSKIIETTIRRAIVAMGCDPNQWMPVDGVKASSANRLVQWAGLHRQCGCSPPEALSLLRWWHGQSGARQPRPHLDIDWDDRKLLCTYSWMKPTFDDMGLSDNLLRGLYTLGCESPLPIQADSINRILNGKHTMIHCKEGGKTTAFAIGMLQKIDLDILGCQALVLTSSSEKAQMFQKTIADLGDYLQVTSHACVSDKENLRTLREGIFQFVVGTPDLILDAINHGALDLHACAIFCVDDADEMLSLGFKAQIYDVSRFLSKKVQFCLSSQIMSTELLDVADNLMHGPVKILTKRTEGKTIEGIRQFYIDVEREQWKLEALSDLFDSSCFSQCIVYCKTQAKVEWLKSELQKKDFTACCIHAGMPCPDRISVSKQYLNGFFRILISNFDLPHLGVDLGGSYASILYDLPSERHHYVECVGRAGAFGRKGVAIILTVSEDERFMRDLEQYYNKSIEEMPYDIDVFS